MRMEGCGLKMDGIKLLTYVLSGIYPEIPALHQVTY
jgi:hypothetical protein